MHVKFRTFKVETKLPKSWEVYVCHLPFPDTLATASGMDTEMVCVSSCPLTGSFRTPWEVLFGGRADFN